MVNSPSGLGDSVRGGAIDFVDSVTGTSKGEKSDASVKGAQKTKEGIARMEHGGTGAPTGNQSDPASGVVTVDDIHAKRAAGDNRYGEPVDPRFENV